MPDNRQVKRNVGVSNSANPSHIQGSFSYLSTYLCLWVCVYVCGFLCLCVCVFCVYVCVCVIRAEKISF